MIRSSFFGLIGLNCKIRFRILATLKKRLVKWGSAFGISRTGICARFK